METAAMSIRSTVPKTDDLKPISVTVEKTKRISGLGETKIWELIGNGTLESVSVGRRRLVIYASLCRLLTPTGPQSDHPIAGENVNALAGAINSALTAQAEMQRGAPSVKARVQPRRRGRPRKNSVLDKAREEGAS
jgi:hypothetical protein